MSDNELLLAISDIVDECIEERVHYMETGMNKEKQKYNYADPYEYIEAMEAVFPPSWNKEGESMYQKYKDQIDRMGTFESNLEIIKSVVNEHCKKLSAMKI